jgi:molecular chaperone GrpE (heat shock protein)
MIMCKIEEKITELFKENIQLKNEIENMETKFGDERKEIFLNILQILDTFERAELTIRERNFNTSDDSKKSIERLLTAKKKTLSVLEKYGITKIVFENNISVDEYCKIVDVEPDNNHPNNYILSVEKDGYLLNQNLLREAEVIVVKN